MTEEQAVSKWESAQCCPDIQLLPAIAELFEVTIDELMGYKAADGLGDICLKIRNYFTELPEKQSFEKAYRIATLLHEIALTDGIRNSCHGKRTRTIPSAKSVGGGCRSAWKRRLYRAEEALKQLSLSLKEESGNCFYRLDESFSYIPPLLPMLCPVSLVG